ncbi:MAG: cation:dicarboxylase symporter family transporter [Crocosphaera sp.]|nr:cation:dicarboxylase symporter family transporter [Crocosphaera sp.]
MRSFIENFKNSLSTQILTGLVLGIVCGLFFGEMASTFSFMGDIFLRLFQMPVIPYIVVSIISSLGRLSYEDAKSIFLKGGIVLMAFWVIILSIIVLFPLGFPSWQSSAFFSTSLIEEGQSLSLIELFIPQNPFHSMANTIVPSLVLFCIAIGLALITVENKQALLKELDALTASLLKITGFVAKLTPYGVFAIAANAAGTLPLEAFKRLGVYIVIQAAIALILSFWVLPGLIAALTPLKYKDVIHAYRTPLITAFAAANLLIVLPLIITRSRELLLALDPSEGKNTLNINAPLEVLVPVSFTFPSMGKLISLAFIPFAGWYSGNELLISQYPTFLLAGAASLFGDGISTMRFLLNLFGIPADMLQIYVTLDQVSVARFGTLLAGMNTVALALIATCAVNDLVTLNKRKIIRFAVVSLLAILLALGSIHLLFTYGLASNYTQDQKLEKLRLLKVQNTAKSVTLFTVAPPPIPSDPEKSRLDQIKERNSLRVCYDLIYPLAYFNSQESRELVGFNIEMAHILAKDLGIALELVPVGQGETAPTIPRLSQLLTEGYCDIVMDSLSLTPRFASLLYFSDPFENYTIAFLVRDELRDQFSSWSKLQTLPSLKIGIVGESDYYKAKIKGLIPNAELIPIDSYDVLLQEENSVVDVIATSGETGAAWTILHPDFTIAVPKPVIAVPVSYGLPYGEVGLREVVNAWLELKRQDGTMRSLYDYWVQGKTESVEPPRWSIIRNVLGWVR